MGEMVNGAYHITEGEAAAWAEIRGETREQTADYLRSLPFPVVIAETKPRKRMRTSE
jgi:hypothetical protein